MFSDQNHNANTRVIPYDYVFIGMGASNGLMLLEFIKRGYHQTKRIAVIEKAQKNIQTGMSQLDEVVGTRTRAIQRQLRGVDSLPAADSDNNILPDIIEEKGD